MIQMDEYTSKAQEILNGVQDILMRYKQNQLRTEHILLSMLEKDGNVGHQVLRQLVKEFGTLRRDTEKAVREYGMTTSAPQGQIYITPNARRVLEEAKKEAARMQDIKIGGEHLLVALLKIEESMAARILTKYKVALEQVYTAIHQTRAQGGGAEEENKGPLQRFTTDLNEMALKKELMPVIGREDEIRRMIQILGRKTKNNPVIVGDSGVGKTAVVEGLAQRIVEGNIPEYLKGKRVMALDMGRLVAGTKLRGEFEERMKAVVDEVKKSAGEIILFIDELHTLVGTGSAEGSMDAANLLKPPLARGELRCIGATTLDEYRKRIEKDKALERRFQMVMIEEPSAEDAIDILNGLREVFEKHHGVRITGPAIEAAVKLSDRYITERFLPDKAIDLIDEAASKIKLETTYLPSDLTAMEKQLQTFEEEISEMVSHSEYEQAARKKMEMEKMKETYSQQYEEWKKDLDTKPKVVNEYVIAEIVEKWTGIPTTRMLRSEKEKILNLEAMMHEKIVDQEEAVTAVAQAVRRSKAGLKDPKRPSGSFLFLGPTGVGKTELAKALAEILFGSEEALVRIDMSEYGEKFAVSRLIGSPPGYVGYDEGGQLTEAIRRRPYSVILMDEIDKAHPETYHILLQLMEDGRLTDGKGHVVDFRNTILILTSNIASDEIVKGKRKLGFGDEDDGNEEIKTVVSDELKKFFKPELINRLDNIIVFKTLSQEDMKKIVSILMVHLNERVVDKHIKLNLSEDAQEFLARKGYDPSFGARPLRRMMEKYIEVPLSDLILEEKVKEGDSVQILVDQDQDKLHFEVMVE